MLVSFDDLKNIHGMPHLTDAARTQYEYLLETAEEECLEWAGIELDGTATEYFAGGFTEYVLTRHPVKAITSVTVGGDATTDYRFNDRSGKITLGSAAYGEVVVTYTLGFTEVPNVIYRAIATTVQYWAKLTNNNLVGVTSRNTDMGDETVEQYEIPLIVKNSLGRFRREAT